jgi:cation diffusion facilitator family transporter
MADSVKRFIRAGTSVTVLGSAVNVLLIILKFTAGVLGNSQALIADAVHSVSDLASDAVVVFGIRVGRKEPDERHPFGHARIETVATALVGLLLVGTALYIGVEAGWDIYERTEYHPTPLALAGAAISIILKEALYHYTVYVGRRIGSPAIIANAWHHRSDALSSVAVLLGVAAAQINPDWHVLDALAALVVSFFVIKVGLDVLKGSLKEFTDTAPEPEVIERIVRCAEAVGGVMEAHDVRARTSGGLVQMEIHIVVDGDLSVTKGHGIAKEVEVCLIEALPNLERVIVHVDPDVRKNGGPENR